MRHLAIAAACVIVAATAVLSQSTNGTFVFDAPYSVAVPSLKDEVRRCSAASGFDFRQGSRPIEPQLSRMCDDSACAGVLTQLLSSVDKVVNATEAGPIAQAFAAFGLDMLKYCWFFRRPSEPCPKDPHRALALHLVEWDNVCKKKTPYSFLYDEDSRDMNYFTNVNMAIYYSQNFCEVPECTEILQRMHYLYLVDACWRQPDVKVGKSHPIIVSAYDRLCRTVYAAEYPKKPGYYFQAGPTLPLHVPDPTTAAPTPEPSTTTLLDNVSSMAGSSSDVDPTIEAPLPTETPTSFRRTKPPPSPATTTPSPTTELGSEESAIPTISLPENTTSVKEQSEPRAAVVTGAPLIFKTKDNENQDVDKRSSSPAPSQHSDEIPVLDINESSSHPVGVTLGIPVVLFAFVCIAFLMYRRKRRNASSSGEQYAHLESPAPADSTPEQDDSLQDGLSAVFSMSAGSTIPCTKIPKQSLKDIRLIGTGGHALVYLVRDIQSDRFLASKRLVKNQLTTDKIDAFVAEIQLVATLQHPCIVEFVGASWTNRTDIQALFEFMDGGDLRTHLEATKAQSGVWSADKLQIALDVAEALVYVHSRVVPSVVHRDIKSRNVLLTSLSRLEQEPSRRRAKLTDFGVAREQSSRESMTTGVGTSRWLAPEVIIGGGAYGSACDIYSLGVVLTELDTHRVPFSDLRGEGGATSLPEITILTIVAMEGAQPSLSESCPEAIASLARACMSFDPERRPRAEDVVVALLSIVDLKH